MKTGATTKARHLAAALWLGGAALTLGGCGASAPVEAPARDARAITTDLFEDRERYGETRALIVLRDGKPLLERYGAGYGPGSRLVSWSMAKTATAVLVGFLVGDGRLDLDGPAPVPAWQRPGDPRGAITLRQLLHMSSGLEHREEGDPVWDADTVRGLFGAGADHIAGYAEAKPPQAAPGERFVYSSLTSVILADIVTRALTDSPDPVVRRAAMQEFIAGRLAEPLGLTSLRPEYDGRGTFIGGSILHATARDYAKFGEFLRLRGVVDGQRLLSERWFAFMLAPSPNDASYGGHVWLNRPRPAGGEPVLWPDRGPPDLFAAIGHQGQYIIVSPGQKLTVVRLGISTDEQIVALRAALADLVARY